MITYESLREQINSIPPELREPGFSHLDAMQQLIEYYRGIGEKIVSRKTPESMRRAIKKLLDSPEYELDSEKKISILQQVIADLQKKS